MVTRTSPPLLRFIRSGCTVLDLVLGGGWPLGRISNIVGDKSTGKTLLAIEACAYFNFQYPAGQIYYREAEAAFDQSYAQQLGMPIESVAFWDEDKKKQAFDRVEVLFNDLEEVIATHTKSGKPALYIVDSLDALSDAAEMESAIDKPSYGASKPKVLSQTFRRLVRKIEASGIHFMVISQIRDNIGVTFGETKTRSGGHALDFYASSVVWLAKMQDNNQTINGVTRPVSIRIRAKCKKNKIALPLRECEFDIRFKYGIDSLRASVDWLASVKALDKLGFDNEKDKPGKICKTFEALGPEKLREKLGEVDSIVQNVWNSIELDFLPKTPKLRY